MCLCLGAFLGSYFIRVIDLQSSAKLPKGEKNQFLEKSDPLMDKFQNFVMKEFTGTWIHVFLPSFSGIGQTEVAKRRVRGIHHEKVGILPISLWLLERSGPKFYRVTLSPFPIPLQSFVQIRSVFEEIYSIRKCLPDSLKYRRESCRLLADNSQ